MDLLEACFDEMVWSDAIDKGIPKTIDKSVLTTLLDAYHKFGYLMTCYHFYTFYNRYTDSLAGIVTQDRLKDAIEIADFNLMQRYLETIANALPYNTHINACRKL